MTYFISGHTDLSYNEFISRYKDPIDQAIKNNGIFVIGDAPGVDTYSNSYLCERNIDNNRVIIYHIGLKPKNNPGNFNTCGGFKNHEEKDATMTLTSDYDILYIRSIEEQKRIYGKEYKHRISGTEKNLIRRKYSDITVYYNCFS